jgi:hypothetical protein
MLKALAHEVTAQTADPIVQYVRRYPKEFAVPFAKSACQSSCC